MSFFKIGENEWPPAAHFFRIALHDLEARSHMGGQIDLVNDQKIRAGDAGAAFTRDLVPCRDINDVDGNVGEVRAKGSGKVIAAGLDEDQLKVLEEPLHLSDRGQVDGCVLADRRMRTATRLDAEDALGRQCAVRKTASVMKLVINGFAGAACIEMGGYDYHGGARAEGEVKDERAGRCMGACIDYAARIGVPLMMYVFSDGSVSSNGAIDNSVAGRGKGEWVSDNSSTAAAFFMVYNPGGRAQLRGATPLEQAMHQQLGYFDAGASVVRTATPAANNVNLLVNTVILNYMALHGEEGNFANLFPGHGLGNNALQDQMTAFEAIVSGTIPPLNPI